MKKSFSKAVTGEAILPVFTFSSVLYLVPGFLFRFDEIRIYTAGSNAMRRRDADGPCGSFSPEDCEDS